MTSPRRPEPSRGRVRLGILGLGAVAQAVHLPLLERLRDHYEIAAIADLSPTLVEQIGLRYQVSPGRRQTSVDGLLAGPDLDALVVLTSGSHGAATMAGFDHGLHVFAEKPLAFTLTEADGIADRQVARPDLRLQVGYMKLHDPAVTHALDVAATEGLGAPRAIEVTVLHPTAESQLAHARLLPPPEDVPPSTRAELDTVSDDLRRTALGDAAGPLGRLYTDILLGSVIHDLALVRAFAGDPTSIDAIEVWPEDRWPPSVELAGRLPNDGRVAIHWHFLPEYPAYREEVRVVYEAATIELAFPSPYLLHRPTELRITRVQAGGRLDAVWTSTTEAFEQELLAFHALVTDGGSPVAGVAEGRADIVTCQRAVARRAVALGLAIGGEAAE